MNDEVERSWTNNESPDDEARKGPQAVPPAA